MFKFLLMVSLLMVSTPSYSMGAAEYLTKRYSIYITCMNDPSFRMFSVKIRGFHCSKSASIEMLKKVEQES